jgi:threonine/homoserine/homoserine lactone efflux protein
MGALWAFVGVAALVIVTPGPDTALTVRNALLGGPARRDGARPPGWRSG